MDTYKTNEDGFWGEIIKLWQEEIHNTLEMTKGLEVGYVHCEHGGTHLLGIAAAKAGYSTIREVLGRRYNKDVPKGDFGRLDLCLIKDNNVQLIEAKWCEFQSVKETDISSVEHFLEEACEDVRRYYNNHGIFKNLSEFKQRRFGVVYLCPYFENKQIDKETFHSYVKSLEKVSNCILLASVSDDKTSNMSYWDRKYYGTIILVREVIDWYKD